MKIINKKIIIILCVLVTVFFVFWIYTGISKYVAEKTSKPAEKEKNIPVDTKGVGKEKVQQVNIEKIEDKKVVQVDFKQSEKEKIFIDEYNFNQLEKVKTILDNKTNSGYILRNYIDFNEKFNQDIKPIKNCYYLKTKNWKYPYIFWFKLESDKFIKKYWTWYYAYPKYDLPRVPLCFWEGDNIPCKDRNHLEFETTISNPCRD